MFGATKSNPHADSRPDHLVLLPVSALKAFPDVLAWIIEAIPQAPHHMDTTRLFRTSYKRILGSLRRLHPPQGLVDLAAQSGRRFRTHFTCHSMKMGAADRLWELAAAGRIPMEKIPMLLKHKNALEILLPSHTVGYAPRLEFVAKALGSHLLTRQL